MELQAMVHEYTELLTKGTPNGLGQYVHPVYGVSHSMLYKMQQKFGAEVVAQAIDDDFKRRHDARRPAF